MLKVIEVLVVKEDVAYDILCPFTTQFTLIWPHGGTSTSIEAVTTLILRTPETVLSSC
jgi:hypothetical protein